MIVGQSRIISPSIFQGETWNEAEVLGGMVWLWSQHEDYAKVAIDVALDTLLPLIKSKNFAFFVHEGSPIGYVNWAYLNQEQEEQYLEQKIPYRKVLELAKPADNTRIWILTWFVPKNKGLLVRQLMREVVFPENEVHFIWHKSTNKTSKIISVAGYKFRPDIK